MKKQALERLAHDGSTDLKYANASRLGLSPTRFSSAQAGDLADRLANLPDQSPELTAAALKALSALEPSARYAEKIAALAYPAQAIHQGKMGRGFFESGANQRTIFLSALRALAAMGEEARPQAATVARVLERDAPREGFTEEQRRHVNAEWRAFQADAAQTLLAIKAKAEIGQHAEKIFGLWEQTSSRAELRLAQPHEPLIDTCALVEAQPDLASRFAQRLAASRATPGAEPHLVAGALRALGCARPSHEEYARLAAEAFAGAHDSEQARAEAAQDEINRFIPAAEPPRSAAAAALLQMEAADKPDMPSLREVLESLEAPSVPGYERIKGMSAEYRGRVAQHVVTQLEAGDARRREVAALLATHLSVADGADSSLADKLSKVAASQGDEHCLRALLLIADSRSTHPKYKDDARNLFLQLLGAADDAAKRPALRALELPALGNPRPSIRDGASQVPVIVEPGVARELAARLDEVLRQTREAETKALAVRALGSLRLARHEGPDGQRRNYVEAVGSSGALGLPSAEADRSNLIAAVARMGPLDLEGACHLLERLLQSPSDAAALRSAAYYAAGHDPQAAALIGLVGRAPDGAKKMKAAEAKEVLTAVDAALDYCAGLPLLKKELGAHAAALAPLLEKNDANRKLRESVEAKLAAAPAATPDAQGGWIPDKVWESVGMALFALLALGPLWVLFYMLSLPLLYFVPWWVFRLNESLPDYNTKLFGLLEDGVPLRKLLAVGFFHYHPRVLDAWVGEHAGAALAVFSKSPLVKAHEAYAPRPVLLDGQRIDSPAASDFQRIFSKRPCGLVIWGEAQSGKTGLACQLGKWALQENAGGRLCGRHLMLPVLIEPDFKVEGDPGDEVLRIVGEQLKEMTGLSEKPKDELLRELLKRRRVLLIVDGLSEMDKASADYILDKIPELPVNALVITSRRDVRPPGLNKHDLRPLAPAAPPGG